MVTRRVNQEREEMLTFVRELSIACPYAKDNPVECPLFEIRKRELLESFEWVEQLPDALLRYLVDYHAVCISLRQAGCLTEQPGMLPEPGRSLCRNAKSVLPREVHPEWV